MPRSKRYKAAKEKVGNELMNIADAVKKTKETSTTKFDAAIELHIRLGIDTKQSDQIVRGSVTLPHGTGKTKKIAVFIPAGKEEEAKAAGADVIYTEQEIEKIVQTQKIDFDVAVATPDMMRHLGKVAKILGQKGVMPNPRTETIGPNVKTMVSALKAGKVTFKADDSGNMHQIIGRVSFDDAKIEENAQAFLDALKKARPEGAKGTYIKGVYLTSSMGPSVPVQM